ncbi:MAG: hypothetical protein L3J78_04840, partial [Thermoplasmata archaeon]|nr:hypothetical protein [Thermoplasmata archaeon]
MSSRPSARSLIRRMAALVAVLLIAGTFVGGAAAAPRARATASTNFPVHAEFTPNDPFYVDQWGLRKIGAPSAWDLNPPALGSRAVVIAVVDTGVKWTHPDIQANMWNN